MENYKEIVEKLRSTKSESKRKLLDTAADLLEKMTEEMKRLDQTAPPAGTTMTSRSVKKRTACAMNARLIAPAPPAGTTATGNGGDEMTGEEAIRYFVELMCVIDISPAHFGSAVAVEDWAKRTDRMKGAYRIAIAALREQEERSKGCEFCTEPYMVMSGSRMNAEGVHKGCEAKWCPNCGRKLEVDAE